MNVINTAEATNERIADKVAQIVFNGGLVIFPTDTVYGIGCDPYDKGAVERIFRAKGRADDKPLSFYVASVTEFLEYAGDNALAILAARKLMPGPVTLIVHRPAFVPAEVTRGLLTLGFRVPDDPLCLAILERCGPLAATSANLSGEEAYRGENAPENLPDAELLVENGPTRYRRESTIIDVSGPQPRVLREGVLSCEELTARIGAVIRPPVKDRTAS